MNWNTLTEEAQLDEIISDSHQKPLIIFKHSTRCSISTTALNRLERAWNAEECPAFLLDLISYRSISQKIADIFEIEHQSPQVLVISNGQCVYSATHWDINMDEIKPHIK